MAIIRWSERPSAWQGFEELERLQQEMNRLFSSYTGDKVRRTVGFGVFPPMNVSEDADNLYVRAELPGVNPEEIDISVEGDNLTLRGERRLPESQPGVNYHRREREAGRFRRVISLNTKINADAVDAHFKNGVLEITLPKAEELKPRQITVKTSG
ncbi:MAG TPA: heat-shock protein Hsp20 [Syntrophobacteraceae bacterium]|nr:heat-shock protein Hsp20 [Syntrophobacteraceae bacterium]